MAMIRDGHVRSIRWTDEDGPGRFVSTHGPSIRPTRPIPASSRCERGPQVHDADILSWLLPIELTPDGTQRVTTHYDKAIVPAYSFQCYGIENLRISHIDGRYLMTSCSVSPERHSTTPYISDDGSDWRFADIILDPSINLETSPDGLHWKPHRQPGTVREPTPSQPYGSARGHHRPWPTAASWACGMPSN
jgi:hypothetical protein